MRRPWALPCAAVFLWLACEAHARSVFFEDLSLADSSITERARATAVIHTEGGGLTQQQYINAAANRAKQLTDEIGLDAAEVWIACSRTAPAYMNESAIALVRYAPDGRGWAGDKPEWTWEAWVADPLPTEEYVRFIEAVQASLAEYRGRPAVELWAAVAKKMGLPADQAPELPMKLAVRK